MLLLSQQRYDDAVPQAGPRLHQITALGRSAAGVINRTTVFAAGVLIVLAVLLTWLAPGAEAAVPEVVGVHASASPLRG
ncbi:hypothetical protein [Lentzea jiangxiensis]|uniref:Uncharacterized protein n=1 Tax=Lentzea jiangxiensis TaxID=641025 RepID=A0A1H0UGX4_9PSEU|nr:hypothetical protein [Lentzea jiangxiensis]SDP65424.1 hypothetical protein SAMN05421507_1124 [Lentzea jiangxiensis]